jgi:exodeoxyribonuclease V beta subunit
VFLFGGFASAASQDRFYRFYDHQQHKQVFELSKVSHQAHQQAQLEEDRRLYYVAMTRAVFMLFLPHHPHRPNDRQLGGYSRTVMARIEDLGLAKASFEASAHDLDQRTVKALPADQKQIHSPLLKAPGAISNARRQLFSFSSLSQFRQSSVTQHEGFASELTAELHSANTADVLATSQTQRQQVPGGVKTGHVLHGIFEHLDFALTLAHEHSGTLSEDERLMAVVDQQMQHFRLDNQALKDESGQPYTDVRSELAAWVWHTLRKPLVALDGGQLAEVPISNRQHELAFFWQRNGVNLTGFIDLFFAVPGDRGMDYLILDWKSNLSPQGYAPELLNQQVMKQHQYHWQYQLYAMAMADWFNQLNIPRARLKGALYLFSRGIRADEAAPNGVFYDEFCQSDWQLDQVATALLNLAAGGRQE